MSDHCYTELVVSGDSKMVKAFEKKAKGPNGLLDANNFVPYPEPLSVLDEIHSIPTLSPIDRNDADDFLTYLKELPDETQGKIILVRLLGYDILRDGYNQGGYEWCNANWGTKWNFYEIHRSGPGRFSFKTAWSPPIPVIKAMSRCFPELDFSCTWLLEGHEDESSLTFRNGIMD